MVCVKPPVSAKSVLFFFLGGGAVSLLVYELFSCVLFQKIRFGTLGLKVLRLQDALGVMCACLRHLVV